MHHQRIIGPYGRMVICRRLPLNRFGVKATRLMSELRRTANCQSDELDLGRFTIRKLGLGDQRRRATSEQRFDMEDPWLRSAASR